jgi:hypothetical protein
MLIKAETEYPELLGTTQEFSSLMDAITLDRLGVSDLCRMPSDSGIGSLTFQMRPVGGAIERDPSAFVSWVGDFLADPRRSDIPRKFDGLPTSAEKHVFVWLRVGGAAWNVESYMWNIPARDGSTGPTPTEPPVLPPPLTHAWVIAEMSPCGWRWDGIAWRLFARDAV